MHSKARALTAAYGAPSASTSAATAASDAAAAIDGGGGGGAKRPSAAPSASWDEEEDDDDGDGLMGGDGRSVYQTESLYAHAVVLELSRELQPDVLLGWAPLATAVVGAAR